jgi:hypothetical protein
VGAGGKNRNGVLPCRLLLSTERHIFLYYKASGLCFFLSSSFCLVAPLRFLVRIISLGPWGFLLRKFHYYRLTGFLLRFYQPVRNWYLLGASMPLHDIHSLPTPSAVCGLGSRPWLSMHKALVHDPRGANSGTYRRTIVQDQPHFHIPPPNLILRNGTTYAFKKALFKSTAEGLWVVGVRIDESRKYSRVFLS